MCSVFKKDLHYGFFFIVLQHVLFQSTVFSASVTLVVLNQRHPMHEGLALKLQKQIRKQDSQDIQVQVASLSFPHLPYWSILPVFKHFENLESDWLVFVNEYATVNTTLLKRLLLEQEGQDFIGRGLSSPSPSGLHHYADPSEVPLFPDTRTAVVVARDLVQRAAEHLLKIRRNDFVIDPGYELAKYLKECCQAQLTNSEALCVGGGACAVSAANQRVCNSDSPASGLHIAVKTWSGNHETRLPVLRRTWLREAPNHVLYSDVTDAEAGTVRSGVNNTERGHCAKTMAILRRSLGRDQEWRWLLLADDDTLISIPRLLTALSCYVPRSPSLALSPLVIGEVYGYQATPTTLLPYPTGGSGVVFSRAAVEKIVSSVWCECPAPSSPDDMTLGQCLQRRGLPLVHLGGLHQNAPPYYPPGRLEHEQPISFHGFWQIEPLKVYKKWLRDGKSKKGKVEKKPAKDTPVVVEGKNSNVLDHEEL